MQARYTSRQSLSKRQLSHHDRCGVVVSHEIRMLVTGPLQLLIVLPLAATKASRIRVHGVGNRGRSRLIPVESRCLEGYGEHGLGTLHVYKSQKMTIWSTGIVAPSLMASVAMQSSKES
jgi:hypothetical protein